MCIISKCVTHGFSHVGQSLLARDNNHIIAILHNTVVLTPCKVTKRLAIIDEAAVEKRLHKDRNVGSNLGRVVPLKDVIGEESANGNGVVLLRDGLSLGDVTGDRVESLVGGSKDGDVCCRHQSFGNVRYKSEEFSQGGKVWLGSDDAGQVVLCDDGGCKGCEVEEFHCKSITGCSSSELYDCKAEAEIFEADELMS